MGGGKGRCGARRANSRRKFEALAGGRGAEVGIGRVAPAVRGGADGGGGVLVQTRRPVEQRQLQADRR
jgi:hypothetical protein